jgi:hypothetical protein
VFDRILTFGGLAVILAVVVIWVLFPIYDIGGGKSVRRPIWSPAELPIRHGYDDIAPEDIERLSKDPAQREILESMRSLPRSYSATPIWVGRRGNPKNVLFGVVFLLVAAYAITLKVRGIA